MHLNRENTEKPGVASRSRLRLAALAAASALAAALIVTTAGGSGAQAAQGSAATQLLRAAVHNALARTSVHELQTVTSAQGTGTVTTDAGTSAGRQEIKRPGGERAQVLVVGGVAYFSGTQTALTNYFGLPAAVARKVATRWVSVPSSSAGYSVVAGGATLSGVLGSFAVPGHLSETAPTQVDGQAAIGIKGVGADKGATSITVSATVYVSRGSTPLPVRATYTFSKGGSVTLELSNWNEHVAITVPTNVIPEAQLQH
jgi:hypothetical protein